MRNLSMLFAVLLAALASPASAAVTDDTWKAATFHAALADAQKALDATPPDQAQARFILLAVGWCAFDYSGWQNQVPDKDRDVYTALAAKLWPDEKIDVKNRDEALKVLDPVVLKYAAPTSPQEREEAEGPIIVYPSVLAEEVNIESGVSIGNLAKWLTDATKQYPEAMKRSLQFVAEAPSPKWFTYYVWRGSKSQEARAVQNTLLDLYTGPAVVANHSNQELLPWSLKAAKKELDEYEKSDDPQMMLFKANEIRRLVDLALFADKENEKAKELDARQKALVASANKIRAAQVKANRVPPPRYRGDDAAELKKQFAAVFAADNPTRKVLAVSLYDQEWVERAIVTSALNNVQAGIYRLLEAAVVVKAENRYWVHPVTFARQWTGIGNKFGPPKVHSWYDRYEILADKVQP